MYGLLSDAEEIGGWKQEILRRETAEPQRSRSWRRQIQHFRVLLAIFDVMQEEWRMSSLLEHHVRYSPYDTELDLLDQEIMLFRKCWKTDFLVPFKYTFPHPSSILRCLLRGFGDISRTKYSN